MDTKSALQLSSDLRAETKKVIGKSFLHSCYIRKLNDGGDAVMVAERLHYEDGSDQTVLRPILRPERSFWITKPGCRTYTEKREIEDVKNLDQFTVKNSEMSFEMFKALNGYYPKGYVDGRTLLNSPYVYGADIDIQTLIKSRYKQEFDKLKIAFPPPTTGFFDIERSVIPATMDIINLISVTHENKVYTAIHKLFFYKEDANGVRTPGDVDELAHMSNAILSPIIDDMFKNNKYLARHKDKLPFEFHYFVGDTEKEMLEWIFGKIHENRTNFMGIWNLDYDIPAVLEAMRKNKLRPEDLFCTPGLPEELKFFSYKPDTRKADHIVDKWHWVNSSSTTQFYDAMCLYGKLRTVTGKESSYSLDYILQKNGIAGKLNFPELQGLDGLSKIDWHRHMQMHEFYRYTIYNQADVVWIQLMEWLNGDANSMLLLSDISHLSKFPRQTRRFADTMFRDWISQGKILGVAGETMRMPHDHEMVAIGGAVLSPNRMDDCGLKCIAEYPNLTTRVTIYGNDIDFTGMYPNTGQAANVSKETKLNTTLYIKGPYVAHAPQAAVEVFFGYVVNLQDNAMLLAKEFFNLPGFVEMEELFDKEFPIA